MLLNYISIPIFLVSFALGMFFIYVLGPQMKRINVYPTPEIVDSILFKDKADNCFQFKANEVKCPENENDIFKIPIQ